jgi:hypothetical protein
VKVSRTYIDELSPNSLLAWFLISSYCYYVLSEPVMTDMDFDYLTERLKEEYDNVNHPHKLLVTKDNLKAGTGFDIDYPTIVKCTAVQIIENEETFE